VTASVRVVLYAEGPGETRGERKDLPTVLEPLEEDHLGPAHFLVRRALAHARGIAETQVVFLSPLRIRGRPAYGSVLHDVGNVRKLLAFERVRPSLAMLLVDADGKGSLRRAELRPAVERAGVSAVLAIAVQEFEAWLIAEHVAAARILGRDVDTPPEPDGMSRGEAKERWTRWVASVPAENQARIRAQVAKAVDLDALAKRSASFRQLLDDLRAVTPG
jgi:hypothetical protein